VANIDLTKINALAELERIGWKYDLQGDEARVACPCHDDKNPSASINVEKNQWRCYTAGCEASGDILSFLANALNTTRVAVYEDLCSRYAGLRQEKVLNPKLVEQYHNAIWEANPSLRELRKRGITDEMIRDAKLGINKGRITIPVQDKDGFIVNIRRYMPGAPGDQKMRNTRGYGKLRLYQEEQVDRFNTIVICGGELKAVLCKHYLNPSKIGAVSATGGESNWDPSLSHLLEGKDVVILFDIDTEGKKATDRVAAMLSAYAKKVRVAELPLDESKYPHGDVNDWFGREDATSADLIGLIKRAPLWEPPALQVKEPLDRNEPEDIDLHQAADAERTGKRVRLTAVVSAIDTAPYLLPKDVRCSCTRNKEFCIECPVFHKKPDEHGFVDLTISAQSPALIGMVETSTDKHRKWILDALCMPPCDVVEFTPRTFYNVHDVRLTPQLEIGRRDDQHVTRPAYIVSKEVESNVAYRLIGRSWPHPKTQQAILLANDLALSEDSLNQFKPKEDELDELAIFKPKEWTVESLHARLNQVYEDLEANVTRIFHRRDMHLMVDVIYHTPLLFEFDSRLEKGWGELLIVGDTAQGKSESTLRMMRHYGLGERIECKNATVAGLLGGLQQLGNNRWFVTWGVIPTHDKRLVILEEIKGTSTEVLGKLTDMRSTGIAEIPKIEKRRSHARTRLVMVSNPRSDRPLAAYNFGVEAVKELIGSLEDIRRFDAVLIVAEGQVPVNEINKLMRKRPKVPHQYTSELCRRNILWAWTRGVPQVRFTNAAEEAILDKAVWLCGMYSESMPIVDRGSMRFKLARLSAGLAARTFSHDDDDRNVLVIRRCHVEFIAETLDRLYSDNACGYKEFSSAMLAATSMTPDDSRRVRDRILTDVPFPSDFVLKMLATDNIAFADICDWCGWTRERATKLLSLLVRKNALTRCDRTYRKTPGFIDMLRTLRDSGDAAKADRPDFVDEEEEEF